MQSARSHGERMRARRLETGEQRVLRPCVPIGGHVHRAGGPMADTAQFHLEHRQLEVIAHLGVSIVRKLARLAIAAPRLLGGIGQLGAHFDFRQRHYAELRNDQNISDRLQPRNLLDVVDVDAFDQGAFDLVGLFGAFPGPVAIA